MTKDLEFANIRKKRIFDDLFKSSDHIFVIIDPRKDNVVIPENLKKDPILKLKLSINFNGTTETNEIGIYTFLKFGGDYFGCELPWKSVFCITDDLSKNNIFHEDAPPEFLTQSLITGLAEFIKGKKKPKDTSKDVVKNKKGLFSLLKGNKDESKDENSTKKNNKNPNLKVIK